MDAYLFAGLPAEHRAIFKLLYEKYGKTVSPKLLEKILKMEDWQLSLLSQDQNPFVQPLKNFDGPYMYQDIVISQDFTIQKDIIDNKNFKGTVYEKSKKKFDDFNFPQLKIVTGREATLVVGLYKPMGLTNQKIVRLAQSEPNCKITFPFVLRELHKCIMEYPHLFEQFRKENIVVPIRSQNKIEGENHIPILSLSQNLKPYWRTEPLSAISQDCFVAMLVRKTL